MRSPITTVGELIDALAGYPPDTRVRLAVAPSYSYTFEPKLDGWLN